MIKKWDLTTCKHKDQKLLTFLLNDGWEPYATTVAPEGMKASNYDGATVYYEHIVWLKKEAS